MMMMHVLKVTKLERNCHLACSTSMVNSEKKSRDSESSREDLFQEKRTEDAKKSLSCSQLAGLGVGMSMSSLVLWSDNVLNRVSVRGLFEIIYSGFYVLTFGTFESLGFSTE